MSSLHPKITEVNIFHTLKTKTLMQSECPCVTCSDKHWVKSSFRLSILYCMWGNIIATGEGVSKWNRITEPGYWRQEGQDTQSASSLQEQSFYTPYHSSGPSDKAGLWNPAVLAETSRADSHQCSSIFQWVWCEWLREREKERNVLQHRAGVA